jgi:ParB family chromosome partitioning protein
MQVKQVDPFDINVDDMNERKDNVNTTDLQASVEEQGVIQPPIVRLRDEDAEVPYSVIVGQRRTIAAQAVGLDEIPVVIRDFGDGDALLSSITENVDAFREDISKKDRALAIEQLKEINGWTNSDVADSLGVSPRAIRNWTEYSRAEWEGTAVDPDVSKEDDSGGTSELSEKVDELSDEVFSRVRKMTGGGGEGEELLEKAVVENSLREHDIREASQKVEQGKDPEVAIEEVAESKEEKTSTTQKVRVRITLSNGEAEAIDSFAEDHGMTTNDVAREAITDFLTEKGEL